MHGGKRHEVHSRAHGMRVHVSLACRFLSRKRPLPAKQGLLARPSAPSLHLHLTTQELGKLDVLAKVLGIFSRFRKRSKRLAKSQCCNLFAVFTELSSILGFCGAFVARQRLSRSEFMEICRTKRGGRQGASFTAPS